MSQNDDSTRQAVILGALLHDVGKFAQRADENPEKPRQDHQHWGIDWFQEKGSLAEKLTIIFNENEKEIIRSAINNHHHGEKYISLADAISAGMDRVELKDEEKGDPFADRLISIFSRVSISGTPKKDMYCRLAPLGKDNLQETFPIDDKKCESHEYADLFTLFNKEIKSLNFTELTIPQQVIEQIYFLLWKYTWCIPSAAYAHEPDVSLFDHLKTTAAIAACLYDYNQENKEIDMDRPAFLLVGGDISGIQEYIFNVLSESGRVARRLRARSLLVQIISEIATHRIIHKFNLPLCNIISAAGGNFYVLVPDIEAAEEGLKVLQLNFDKWTYEKLHAEISFNLGWVTTTGYKLGKFNEPLQKLKKILRVGKCRPYQSFLVKDKQWREDKFMLEEVIEGEERICSSCRHHPVSKEYEEKKLCQFCYDDTIIGRELPKAKYIAFFRDDAHEFPILNYSFEIWADLKKGSSAYLVISINDTGYTEMGIGFKYLANYIPTSEEISCSNSEHRHLPNQPVFFDCIADASKGDSLLGYVKADVDDMGAIFRYGFDPEKPDGKYKVAGLKPSISRFCSLSRMLETFFSGYLQMRMTKELKDKERYKEIYTVFSGGDDFFMTGPWNKAIDFVKEMRKEFREFTGENPDFTFSAGIILAKPHEPISFCAELVSEVLKKYSKHRKDKKGLIKDGITLFAQTVSWYELDLILKEAKEVISWLVAEPPIIPRRFAYNLRQYGEMARKSGICEDGKEICAGYLKFVPSLTNDINRNLSKKEQQAVFDWAEALKPNTDLKIGKNLPYLKSIMEYVLIYTRGGH